MNVSFIIITNGEKNDKIINQIKTIEDQKIKNYEIIVCGITDLKFKRDNIIYIEAEKEARNGSLGGLRNIACSKASYDNLVISDDDMLFSVDWYKNIKDNKEFDILTPRVKTPDGTRFWDHACYMSPENGHKILNPNENDNYLYMSGGQSWVMKKYVFDKVRWDENILIYSMKNLEEYAKGKHNEDTDYSLRCRKNNFNIKHVPRVKVYHNDSTYTSIGRIVRRRAYHKDQKWCLNINLPTDLICNFGLEIFSYGFEAEGIDLIRKSAFVDNNFSAVKHLEDIETRYGGKLDDSQFLFDNKEYNNLLINS